MCLFFILTLMGCQLGRNSQIIGLQPPPKTQKSSESSSRRFVHIENTLRYFSLDGGFFEKAYPQQKKQGLDLSQELAQALSLLGSHSIYLDFSPGQGGFLADLVEKNQLEKKPQPRFIGVFSSLPNQTSRVHKISEKEPKLSLIQSSLPSSSLLEAYQGKVDLITDSHGPSTHLKELGALLEHAFLYLKKGGKFFCFLGPTVFEPSWPAFLSQSDLPGLKISFYHLTFNLQDVLLSQSQKKEWQQVVKLFSDRLEKPLSELGHGYVLLIEKRSDDAKLPKIENVFYMDNVEPPLRAYELKKK
jgi:hypothetical protein